MFIKFNLLMASSLEGLLLVATLLTIGFLLKGKRKNKKNDFVKEDVPHAEAEITETLDEKVSGANGPAGPGVETTGSWQI